MSWLPVILLALAAFAVAAFVLRLDRGLWTSLLAALVFGLAGYAFQARPDLGSAPRAPASGERGDPYNVVDGRKQLLSPRYRSGSDKVLIADALTRRGQFANAAAMLRGATADDPRDADAWLALGNVLVEHADGLLTPASLYAFRQAAELAPGSPAPGYFLGLSLLRQGRMMEGRQVWLSSVEAADPADEGVALVAERLGELEAMLAQAGALPSPSGGEADTSAAEQAEEP